MRSSTALRHNLTMACFAARRYPEAIEHAKRGIAEAPELSPPQTWLAAMSASESTNRQDPRSLPPVGPGPNTQSAYSRVTSPPTTQTIVRDHIHTVSDVFGPRCSGATV